VTEEVKQARKGRQKKVEGADNPAPVQEQTQEVTTEVTEEIVEGGARKVKLPNGFVITYN